MTMTEKMKKIKVPRILTMAKFKSSIELGAWFAGVAISNAIIMMTFNWLLGMIQNKLDRMEMQKVIAQVQKAQRDMNVEANVSADMDTVKKEEA